jgi:soluble lytic murein transglycosylase
VTSFRVIARAVLPMVALVAAAAGGGERACAQDVPFLAAREAFVRGDAARLDSLEPALRGTPLAAYVEGWQLRLRFGELPDDAVRAYLERYSGQYPAHRLRIDWIRSSARNLRWDVVENELARIPDPDTELRCLGWQARLARGDRTALADARPAWFATREQPEACAPVFDALFASGTTTEADRWQRVRLVLDVDNAALAVALTAKGDAGRRLERKALDAAARDPQRVLDPRRLRVATRAERETALYALGRLAARDPLLAVEQWARIASRFVADDRAWGQAVIATAASRRHLPQAVALWRDVDDSVPTPAQRVWRARAALREADWPALETAIAALPADERDSVAWQYWRARAAAARGRRADADALFMKVAQDTGFHGQLAREALGPALSAPAPDGCPSEADVAAAAALPGLARALALYRIGLRYEGNLEWHWSIRGLDDRMLFAAAELARRDGWYERTIATADRAQVAACPALRFPTPYRDLIATGARDHGLDEAWVLGLVRQESRFMAVARSGVGASGLMQVMPATARWIARRLGVADWRGAVGDSVADNVAFGTYYLRTVLDRSDGSPVAASAAYNAGPGRALQWRHPDRAIEGAVFVDTIPFAETRDYVRKVMANATGYARLAGRPADRLTDRLGQVPPRSAAALASTAGLPLDPADGAAAPPTP